MPGERNGLRGRLLGVRRGAPAGESRPLAESWRAWRRSRPFWGGLLLVLGGLELMVVPLSGVLSHGAVKLVIYIGIGGVFGVLIGVLLVVSGLLLCVNPVHRVFYGVAGVVLGILSFPASNLGGFFIGMLLAIIGGSLAFAWTPVEQSDPVTMPVSAVTAQPADNGKPAKPARRMAIAAMPLVMAAGLLGSPGPSASPASSPPTCILWVICFPSPSPTPTPSPSVSPSPGSLVPGGVLPGGSPSPSASPNPSASPSPKQKRASATPGLVAATATSVIKAGSAELTDFAYQGAATLPTAAGSVQEMKFTAGALTLSGGVTATVTQDGATTATTSPALDFSGSVVLYATQLSGCEGPLCVTLTPTNVVTVLLKLLGPVTAHVSLTLTSVTTDQPLVTAGSLQASGLNISVG